MNKTKEKEKDKNISNNKFFIKPYSDFWIKVKNVLLYGIVLNMFFIIISKLSFKETNPINKLINKLISMIPDIFILASFLIILLFVGLYIFISKTKDKMPEMDDWATVIIRNHLKSEGIYYKNNILLCNYDVSLNEKNGMECCAELSDKSNNYIYFFQYMDIDQNVMVFEVSKKQSIPNKCSVDINEDKIWNFIPLGKAVNNQKKTISDIGWYINDNNINEDVVSTIPSNSILVCGATGGGKSVFQNGIVGHMSRHSENFQMCGIDIKQVEFNNFIGVKSVKQIGFTIEEGANIIKQARQIMNDRYTFMRNQKKNNIYDIEDVEVDYYEINGNKYQFDEMFSCILLKEDCDKFIDINNKSDGFGMRRNTNNENEEKFVTRLLTIDKIYDLLENDVNVIIDESYMKI